ncbi:MAG: FecR family protein [Mangrovibacterium sp.]
MNQISIEILYKFLHDQCSPQELSLVNAWIEEGMPSLKRVLEHDWELGATVEADLQQEELEAILVQIHSKLDMQKKTFFSTVLHAAMRAAAILFFPLLAALLYVVSQDQEALVMIRAVAPEHSHISLVLPDSTLVYLNNSSVLEYPSEFSETSRNLFLQGEAYFEVKHNPQKPFVVNSGDVDVAALGTKFNVRTLPEEDYIVATLAEGRVVIDQQMADKKLFRLADLQPSQQFVYNKKQKTFALNSVEVDRYICWKDGLMLFRNSTMIEFAERISQRFGVDVKVTDEAKDLLLTASFKDESLEKMLEFACQATGVQISEYLDLNSTERQLLISK